MSEGSCHSLFYGSTITLAYICCIQSQKVPVGIIGLQFEIQIKDLPDMKKRMLTTFPDDDQSFLL